MPEVGVVWKIVESTVVLEGEDWLKNEVRIELAAPKMIRASNIPMVAPLFIFKLYLIIILVMAWLSTTSNWIKKQYFNSTHLIDWLYQGHAEGPISIFGMPFA